MPLPSPEAISDEVIVILVDTSSLSEEDIIHDLIYSKCTFTEANIDSLDLLDSFFAIDKAFGIHLPQEEWTQLSINDTYQDANGHPLYTIQSVVAEVHKQLAAKKA